MSKNSLDGRDLLLSSGFHHSPWQMRAAVLVSNKYRQVVAVCTGSRSGKIIWIRIGSQNLLQNLIWTGFQFLLL